jgi:prepilin-type N-terminal cleavage/methylation domain-containing protein
MGLNNHMKINRLHSKGFSVIEVLAVMLILSIVAGFTMIGFQNYARYQQYNQAVNDVQFILKQTRLAARNAQNDSDHGIHFANDSITRFVGDTFASGAAGNTVIPYSLVTIQWNLTAGVDDIVFDKLTGLPSATGTIMLSGNNYSGSTTFSLSEVGVIQ